MLDAQMATIRHTRCWTRKGMSYSPASHAVAVVVALARIVSVMIGETMTRT